MNSAYKELTVSIPFTLVELIELKALATSELESMPKRNLRPCDMEFLTKTTADILDKLSDAYDRYFEMSEEV